MDHAARTLWTFYLMARVCELAADARLRWPKNRHLFGVTAAFMTVVCTRVGGYIAQPGGPETTPPGQESSPPDEMHHMHHG
jgi:hypothetical protein